jgi:molybdopterin/thiamine biosynthesis adenylyltransferase
LQKLFTENNAREICLGHDVLVDALDNIPSRLVLERTAEELQIPFVHGAIAGWYGQVATVLPGDRLLSRLYGENSEPGAEKELGNPSFTPALIASLQVSEVVKLLINRGELLRNRIFYLDTLNQEFLFL